MLELARGHRSESVLLLARPAAATMSASKKVRVTVLRNSTAKQAPLLVECSAGMAAMLKAANAKLKCKGVRAFLSSGEELSELNFASLLSDGAKVVISQGEFYESHLTKGKGAKSAAAGGGSDSSDSSAVDESSKPDSTESVERKATKADGALPPELAVQLAQSSGKASSELLRVSVLAVKAWLEEEAVKQLHAVANSLPRVLVAVGMPDLHPGQGFPVGTAFASERVVYPMLIGGDIGCGMSLVQTNLKIDKASDKKLERWLKKLQGLDDPWRGNTREWLEREFQWPAGLTVAPVTKQHFGSTDLADEAAATASADSKAGDSASADGSAKLVAPIPLGEYNDSLGTIGGGNHFAELQQIEKVVDQQLFEQMKLSAQHLYLLVHSGSRGLGSAILDEHAKVHGIKGLQVDTPEAAQYLTRHDAACAWAKRNRALIAERFLDCLGSSLEQSRCVFDIWHNNVVSKPFSLSKASAVAPASADAKSNAVTSASADSKSADAKAGSESSTSATVSAGGTATTAPRSLWLHRKGAAPADMGPLVIPGSRGAFSYLVAPCADADALEYAAFSLAHGAGRKWHRGKARATMKSRHPNPQQLRVTELNSHVICEDKDLLYEEAPQAYKDVTEVIEDLVNHKLIRVVAILKPLITYKMRARAKGGRDDD